MKNHANALILLARVPVRGRVKTRLHPTLDHDTIFDLYTHFLHDSIDKICAVENADRFIGGYPAERLDFFDDIAAGRDIRVFAQRGEGLGEKMRGAFADRFAEKYEKVAIIGSDSPSLPVEYIEAAFRSGKDVVLGPSTDRGYYLVAMNREIAEIFDGITWGSDRVLAETLERMKKAGASLDLLPIWYDVDRVEDLRLLKTHLSLSAHGGADFSANTLNYLNRLDF
jgi:rSAM/selenodomain-associated transferase 1